MARLPRIDCGGKIYHVINRADARRRIFRSNKDYERFLKILREGCFRIDMRLLAYCVMPNHWHLVLWSRNDGDLSFFVQWVSVTHTRRHHVRKVIVGIAPVS